jgi:hypothetical protein
LLVGRLAEARQKAAHPLSEAWGEAKTLLAAVEQAPNVAEARVRLRSVVRRIISEIWVLMGGRGRDRLAVVQLWFADERRRCRHRDYLILHRPSKSNGSYRAEGFWCVRSWTDKQLLKAKMPAQFDLRHADPTCIGEDDRGKQAWVSGWQEVETHLAALSTADLEGLVFGGCERHPLP